MPMPRISRPPSADVAYPYYYHGAAWKETFSIRAGRRLTEQHQVVAADDQAGLAVITGTHRINPELAGRGLGDVQRRLPRRNGTGRHQEVDRLLGLDAELGHEID